MEFSYHSWTSGISASPAAHSSEYRNGYSENRTPIPLNGEFQNNFAIQNLLNEESIPEAEMLCFGSIVDANTLLKRSPVFEANQANMYPHLVFEVKPFDNDDFFGLRWYGTIVAILNKKTCRELRKLLDTQGNHLQFDAIATRKQYVAADQAYRQNPGSAIMTVDLTIYGSREDAVTAGDILSDSGTFLQAPLERRPNTLYSNPHYLPIRWSSEQDLIEGRQRNEARATEDAASQDQTQVNASVELSSILDSLNHASFLREQMVVDNRIRTPLLEHQRPAIDFIFRRETGDLPRELCLWRLNEEEDEVCYQHIISGKKSPSPEEAKAGILADDMGLGKTLVMLSTVAGSLDRAVDFVRNTPQNCADGKERKPSGATLVVTRSSLLMDGWIDEIRAHTYPGDIKFHKHHGQGRKDETPKLFEANIVLTTYATVASEFSRGPNILGGIHWFRVVLDEAHDVRNPASKQFQAAKDLAALHRWCLTGTPIQNTLEDLGALVTFLRVPVLENPATFRKYITSQCTLTSRDRFTGLRTLLSTICLRRTRALLNIPEPHAEKRILELTPSEGDEYQKILLEGRNAIDLAVSRRGNKLNSTVLQSLLKLRLFCNNGRLTNIVYTSPEGIPLDPDEALTYLQQRDEAFCAYCSGNVYSISTARDTDAAILVPGCFHLVCSSCKPQYHSEKRKCPRCKLQPETTASRGAAAMLAPSHVPIGPALTPFQVSIAPAPAPLPTPALAPAPGPALIPTLSSAPSSSGTQPIGPDPQHIPQENYPSKLLAFLKDVQENTRGRIRHKSIVFSAWKKTLDLVSGLLKSKGIKHQCIHGSLSLSDRLKVLKDFRSPVGSDILLMTLGTGAVGLNLAVATRIYLLEPQWNPAIEEQAIGRALRYGQKDTVEIVRYVMKGTVEESNVLSRQHKKLQLAGGGFAPGRGEISEEVMASINTLFHNSAASNTELRVSLELNTLLEGDVHVENSDIDQSDLEGRRRYESVECSGWWNVWEEWNCTHEGHKYYVRFEFGGLNVLNSICRRK